MDPKFLPLLSRGFAALSNQSSEAARIADPVYNEFLRVILAKSVYDEDDKTARNLSGMSTWLKVGLYSGLQNPSSLGVADIYALA